ncbi:hypothetical protein U14_00494 [Candidatus Moduliflexus flocculans]|uniref:Uncharacterized protein n=1 Tax=Candidatus Moduliflexus flocculans TaxID=1499966 RepID=A0A0S6VUL5_9BACT|nr:hypothetical protein U14_00494 [Candidatus Moduliflexus flocculans]
MKTLLEELEQECLTAVKFIEALKVEQLTTTQQEDLYGELSASVTHLRIQTAQLEQAFEKMACA